MEEHIDPRLKELGEVKGEISSRLLPRKQQEAFEKLIEELKNQAEIVIIEENLPEEVDSQSESQPQSEELTTSQSENLPE